MTSTHTVAPARLHDVLGELHGREITAIGSEVVELVGAARRVLERDESANEQLADAGLGFLTQVIAPLQHCLEQVDGDTESLAAHADDWRRVAHELDDTRHRLDVPGWTGRAAESFFGATGGFGAQVQQAVTACAGVATLLESSAELMSGARALIVEIVERVVDFIIVLEAAAEASVALTAGASEAAALSAILGEVADRVDEAVSVVDRVGVLLTRIGGALRNVGAVFAEVDAALAELSTARTPAGISRGVHR